MHFSARSRFKRLPAGEFHFAEGQTHSAKGSTKTRIARGTVIALASGALTLVGVSGAQADIFECEGIAAPGPAQEGAAAEEQNDTPLVSASDSVDIITINPKAAVAVAEEGDSETEGEGTSASGGDTGVANQDNESDTHDSCLIRSHDAVDVLTINPEASVAVDDEPLIFGDRDQDNRPPASESPNR